MNRRGMQRKLRIIMMRKKYTQTLMVMYSKYGTDRDIGKMKIYILQQQPGVVPEVDSCPDARAGAAPSPFWLRVTEE